MYSIRNLFEATPFEPTIAHFKQRIIRYVFSFEPVFFLILPRKTIKIHFSRNLQKLRFELQIFF
jgi:hypothetical protein